ncbi:hypothetical protein [Nostoc sp. ChiSLP03a]|uniref:hypothetical protein n=1 Tax=Nostoc sp. ChiSLP03a TaxID=3075380 RepID=UPI002AD4983C|nr:hypothetical protein [Nostoc sp. ChiSLP03a]MDZ8216028.1 hypothetical protein [Nostoc sp. ChiSLP03a]
MTMVLSRLVVEYLPAKGVRSNPIRSLPDQFLIPGFYWLYQINFIPADVCGGKLRNIERGRSNL